MAEFARNELTNIAEHFVDISDVFTEDVDADGLQTMLAAFFNISHLTSGEAFIVNHLGMVECSAKHSAEVGKWEKLHISEPSHLATGAMHTLQTEFTISGQDSQVIMKYAFPLRVRGLALGVVELSDTNAQPLPEFIIVALQNLADLAASVIDRTHCINQTRSLVGQLQTALNSRIVLEQAKGVLAERLHVDCPVAFKYLRNQARREQIPLHQVAQRIISDLPPHGQPMKVAN